MPECYTHVRIATRALTRCGLSTASLPALMAGANGPAPLYHYRRFKKRPQPDLPALAARLHKQDTGAFLLALASYAITPVQQSYVLGFVSHYAVNCTLCPYISAMSKKGMPYGVAGGYRRLEASLDSTLYHQDYKTYRVPLNAATPVLITDELAQVSTLLHEAVLLTYGEDVPALALAETFHDNYKMRRFLISRTGLKKAAVGLLGPLFPDRRGRRSVLPRMQPAKPLKKLPSSWKNPYTGESLQLTLEEILTLAERTATACVSATMRYWLGDIDAAQLAGVLGNNNHYTGTPIAKPQGET